MIISIALTPMVTKAIGYQLTAIIYGILGGAVILYMALTSREVEIHADEEKPQLWDSIKNLVTNRKFWVAGLCQRFLQRSHVAGAGIDAILCQIHAENPRQPVDLPVRRGAAHRHRLRGYLGTAGEASFTLIPIWRAALASLMVAFIPLYFANSLVTAIAASALVGFGFAGSHHHDGFDRRKDHG